MKTKNLHIPITIQDHHMDGHFSQLIGAPRKAWPVRFGVPFPKSALRDTGALVLRDGKTALPFQAQITNCWPNGSIRWLSVLALVDLQVGETKQLSLETSPTAAAVKAPKMKAQGDSLDNGPVNIKASTTLGVFQIQYQGALFADAAPVFELELEDGKTYQPQWQSTSIEREGPLRSRLVHRGEYAAGWAVEFGIELTAGQPWVECFHRLIHKVPGQTHLTVRRLSIRQAWNLTDAQYVVRQCFRGENWMPRDVRKTGRVEVKVSHSRAAVTDHQMVDEDVPSYPPYLQRGLDSIEPWLAISGAERSVMFWTPEPAGHSPQTWSADGSAMTLTFLPEPVEFPQGRAKTHRWRWHFANTPLALGSDVEPRTCYHSDYNHLALLHTLQPMVVPAPAWNRSCKVGRLEHSLPWQPAKHPRVEAIVNHLFDLHWPTGAMNWGDDVDQNYTLVYASTGVVREGAVWTNNEYDYVYAGILQMLRTGQGRLWREIERAAHHALDIDFVYYSDDPWLHHGSPAHSANHTSAASYPSHIWTEGLLHYYYISGDERALEVAKHSGEFLLKYQAERWHVFEGTARESGWTLLALTELYNATGKRTYLDGARRIKEFIVRGTEAQHPLFPGEACFFIGVLAMGLDKLNDVDPDPKIATTIDRIVQWRLDHRLSPEGIPLYHLNSAGRMVGLREIMFPAALAIAHRLTGKPQYRAALRRCLEYWLETNSFYGSSSCTKTTASYYRSWIEAFQELDRKNLLQRHEFPSAKVR